MTDFAQQTLDNTRRKRKKKKDYKSPNRPELKTGRMNSKYELKVLFHAAYQKTNSPWFSYFTDPKTERKNEQSAIDKLLGRVLRGTIRGKFVYANLYKVGEEKPYMRFDSEGNFIPEIEFQRSLKKYSDSEVARPIHSTPLLKMQLYLHHHEILAIREERKEAIIKNGERLPTNPNLLERTYDKHTYQTIQSIHSRPHEFKISLKARLQINPIFNSIDLKEGQPCKATAFTSLHEMYQKAISHPVTIGMVKCANIYSQKQDPHNAQESTLVATLDYRGRIYWKDELFKAQIRVLDDSILTL